MDQEHGDGANDPEVGSPEPTSVPPTSPSGVSEAPESFGPPTAPTPPAAPAQPVWQTAPPGAETNEPPAYASEPPAFASEPQAAVRADAAARARALVGMEHRGAHRVQRDRSGGGRRHRDQGRSATVASVPRSSAASPARWSAR